VCFIVDAAKRLDGNVLHILHQLETDLKDVKENLKIEREQLPSDEPKTEKEFILVLNKVDLVHPKDKILQLISKLNETNLFKATFITAAISGYKVEEFKRYLISRAQPGNWVFSPEVVTNFSDPERAQEIIREKIYQRINQEVPYGVYQFNVGWTDLPDGSLRIDQSIMVPKLSQKAMLIGKQGKTIKAIIRQSAEDLKAIFNRNVYINLMIQHKEFIERFSEDG